MIKQSIRAIAVGLVLLLAACDGGGGGTDGGGTDGRVDPVDAGPGGCRSDEMMCGGACVSTASDPQHCGTCGNACGTDEVCSSGMCSSMGCGSMLVACSGACVDTDSDERNCGSCGTACAPDQTCRMGMCAGGGPIDPPPATCDAPITAADTSSPDTVVGDGNPASCTHAALAAAVSSGGIITFDCGPGDVTIDVTSAFELRIDVDTIIDGGGTVILDGGRTGGRQTRIFEFDSPDYRRTMTRVVLQGLTLQNAEAPASDFVAENPSNPECAWGYRDGQGGAVQFRDGRLHVIDCVFRNNRAAPTGPDTGGGAIYALGALEVVLVGSTFVGNEGSNSGAVGILQSDIVVYNSVFEDNRATGTGQNFGGARGCPVFNHDEQGGAGGNGGALAIDGGSVETVEFCGVTFRNNRGNELGTIFRTPNSMRGRSTFNFCLFDGNHAGDGGGAIWMQDMEFEMFHSAIIGNTSDGLGGGVRIDQGPHGSTLRIENTTIAGNVAMRSLGGGLVFSGEGVIRNCTFAENVAAGGEGFFGAAIVARGPESAGLQVHNTIFWNNRDDHEWTPMTCVIGNPGALPGANNVQWPRLRNGPAMIEDDPCTAGILWQNAMLASLADNGGPTPTMMPPAGSVVIGLGASCPDTDQRGMARPTGSCAAGAVEP